jgi:hypothetical protein
MINIGHTVKLNIKTLQESNWTGLNDGEHMGDKDYISYILNNPDK